jgi:hypothetical protein
MVLVVGELVERVERIRRARERPDFDWLIGDRDGAATDSHYRIDPLIREHLSTKRTSLRRA